MRKAPKIISMSDLRQNAGYVVRGVSSSRESVLVARRGQAAAIMVGMQVYEDSRRELDILRLLARGEKEIEAGVGYELEDVVKEGEGGVDYGHGNQGQV